MQLNTYLHFGDNCREAFEFYRSIFGGEFMFLSTFADGPEDMPRVPDDEKGRIMHVSLQIGDSVLMGSDSTSAFGPPPDVGNNYSISVSTESREEMDRLFAGLSEGGNVAMAPQDMFWGAYFGMCTDKFGINWMLSYETSAG